jgi:hypothetical protein
MGTCARPGCGYGDSGLILRAGFRDVHVTDLADERAQVRALAQQEVQLINRLTEAEFDAVAGGARNNNREICVPIPIGLPPYPLFCF